MVIGPESNEARATLLSNLKDLNLPQGWKIVLKLDSDTRQVRIIFYKKVAAIKLTIKNRTFCLFQNWVEERSIAEETYEDILEKIQKYPKLLETEVEINAKLS